jgi:hypothetical protein
VPGLSQRRSRHAARPVDRGAVAVEFAFIVPLLFLILFGIIDYGLYINDSLSVRQGVREAARQGVVGDWGDSTECGSGELERLSCTAKDRIGPITGDAYIRVSAPEGWEVGDPLTVCALVDVEGVIGLVPTPDYITSRVDMSIERIDSAPGDTNDTDSLPSGATWSGWC